MGVGGIRRKGAQNQGRRRRTRQQLPGYPLGGEAAAKPRWDREVVHAGSAPSHSQAAAAHRSASTIRGRKLSPLALRTARTPAAMREPCRRLPAVFEPPQAIN